MRITWLFWAATIVTALFGVGLLVLPEFVLGTYGMTTNPDGIVVARILGGQLIGFSVLERAALRGERAVREANLRAVLVAELLGFAVALLAALSGTGNGLFWGIVGIFLLFSLWRAYYLYVRPDAIDL